MRSKKVTTLVPRVTRSLTAKTREKGPPVEPVLAKLQRLRYWPELGIDEWREMYRLEYGIVLTVEHAAYHKLKKAVANAKAKRKRSRNAAALAEAAAVQAVAAKKEEVEPGTLRLEKALAALNVRHSAQSRQLEELEGQLALAEEKLAAERKLRVEAQDHAAKVLAYTASICESARGLDALRQGTETVDWDEVLPKYLDAGDTQGDADASYSTMRAWLTPWVRWLVDECSGKATSQGLKKYLTEVRGYSRVSYQIVGKAIVTFTNHHLETYDWIKYIPPRGPVKEKPTLSMPTEMLAELKRHVDKRIDSFAWYGGLVPADRARLAKYLGKFSCPRPRRRP